MIITSSIFLAFGAFFVKHYVVDFLLQIRWMFEHKHIWGHPGGLAHAALHGIATAIILYGLALCGAAGAVILAFPMLWLIAVLLGLLDFGIHYVTDLYKTRINRHMGWEPTNSECFWYLLGLDQLVHYLTYLLILCLWWG